MSVRGHDLVMPALASSAAVAAGALTLALAEVPAVTWIRNPTAWLVGALAGWTIVKLGTTKRILWALLAFAAAALAGTLMMAPVDGVYRWIDLGPLHINAAALLLPPSIVALARIERPSVTLVCTFLFGVLLVLQPDASQASAFLTAVAFLILRGDQPLASRLLGVGTCILIIAASWLRPDPVQPVREVEQILAVALSLSPILAAFASLALAWACVAPLMANFRSRRLDDGAIALSIYLVIAALAPMIGAFPVPLVGLGMSFPVGYWLGTALLRGAPDAENAR